jgi:hypothetical protein
MKYEKITLKIKLNNSNDYNGYDVYNDTTLTEAYANALNDVKKYNDVADWYLNF